jgi:hypothetical protein
MRLRKSYCTDYKTLEQWQAFGDPSLAIAEESLPPNKPAAPSGPTSGDAGTSYTYSATTTDPDGDEVSYLFDWGDGKFSGWVGPYPSGNAGTASHKWSSGGTYQIKVKAKDDHGVQSEWSDPLPVTMPRGKIVQNTLFMRILERFPNAFPILRQIFGL